MKPKTGLKGTAKDVTPQQGTRRRYTKEELEKLRDRDRELVRGRFVFYESPGAAMKFSYRAYSGDDVATYELVDNQIYSLPLGVAKHLNKNGWYPVHQYAVDEDGKPVQKIGNKVRRFGFQSLEFIDPVDIGEDVVNLTTVENI